MTPSQSYPADRRAVCALRDSRDILTAVSVVIPIGPGDTSWQQLVPALAALPAPQIMLAATAPPSAEARALLIHHLGQAWRWQVLEPGRGRQLNAGGAGGTREFLWFLHADSRFTPSTVVSLRSALERAPDALHYFDLAFPAESLSAMRATTLGVRMRSRVLGIPFGDQGLCIRRATWDALGRFDEDAAYGEDHLFVWRARVAGIRVLPTGGTLITSARRYEENGWLRTTARHLMLTARQAVPGWTRLLRAKVDRTHARDHRP